MSIRSRGAAIAAALLALGIGSVQAQTSHAHLGAHVLYNSDYDDFGLGAQLSIPMARHLEFYPSFDYYFQSPGSVWEMNVDVKYRASGSRFDWIYVGTGLNIDHQSYGTSATTGGWNLLAGAESIRGQIHPFAEARVTVTDHTRFQVQGGVNVTLGKHEPNEK
jgi:hypothetical protein